MPVLLLSILLFAAAVTAAGEETGPDPAQNGSTAMGEWDPREGADPALSINEPMYFVVGKNGGETRARFQFSLKYRIFDTEAADGLSSPSLAGLYLGYTQTSLWNLSADSKPFEDSNYRPSIFWELLNPSIWTTPDFLRIGYEHESNGQGQENSRSINTLFFFPAWETLMFDRSLVVGAKFYAYLEHDERNADIDDYRGYADLSLRYGNATGWLVAALWRHGMENKNTVQLDLSYPISVRLLAHSQGYYYIQSFYGYGESLPTYNQRQDLNVRVGFAIVR
jgi:phospholipase A1